MPAYPLRFIAFIQYLIYLNTAYRLLKPSVSDGPEGPQGERRRPRDALRSRQRCERLAASDWGCVIFPLEHNVRTRMNLDGVRSTVVKLTSTAVLTPCPACLLSHPRLAATPPCLSASTARRLDGDGRSDIVFFLGLCVPRVRLLEPLLALAVGPCARCRV